jgi:hypothetical protein
MTGHALQAKPPWQSPWWKRISAALRVSVGIGFVGSISWVFHRNRTIPDAFQLLFVTGTFGHLLLIVFKVWLKS